LRSCVLTTFVLIALAASSTLAQTAPASQPTTRYVATLPPGFKTVTVANRIAWCESADEKWVRATLGAVSPTTRPSTMPSDIVAHIAAKRNVLAQTIASDLGVEPAEIDKLFDEKLLPAIKQLDSFDLRMFYLTLSHARFIGLLRDGVWEDRRFRYNRAAGDVSVTRGVVLTLAPNGTDDVVVPAVYEADDDETARTSALSRVVRENEEMIAGSVSDRSIVLTQLALIEFIGTSVIQPLKLADDQQWFGLGLVGALGAKYAADLTGIERAELIRQMTREYSRMPVKSAGVDLLHPTPATDLRKEYAPYYADAMRRKSTTVMAAWLDRAGEGAVRKTLDAIHIDPPKDGAALVALIKQATGQDLTKELGKH
jgi:hypothetical protein